MIRGWHPALIMGLYLVQAKDDKLKFNPQQPFEFDERNGEVTPGGWGVWVFSLEGFYLEHQMWRNRWSSSNCGFDLALYFGTKLTFVPHWNREYIVYIDPDYRSQEHFRKQFLHPAVIITHPNSRIIWSYRKKKYYKLPSIWVPRPSVMYDGWQDMKAICNTGLFYLYIAFIDLDKPWLSDGYGNEATWGEKEKYEWWKRHLPGQEAYIPNRPLSDQIKKGDWLSGWGYSRAAWDGITNDPGNIASNHGPFMPKNQFQQYDQICMFYKSFWMWGGNTLRVKKVCDPCKEPAYAYDPPARPGG